MFQKLNKIEEATNKEELDKAFDFIFNHQELVVLTENMLEIARV